MKMWIASTGTINQPREQINCRVPINWRALFYVDRDASRTVIVAQLNDVVYAANANVTVTAVWGGMKRAKRVVYIYLQGAFDDVTIVRTALITKYPKWEHD